MCGIPGLGACISWCCMSCVVVCLCDPHYVYVHMVEEKALGVCWVWKPIQSAYKINIKVEAKD